jgi:hypothetical protein
MALMVHRVIREEEAESNESQRPVTRAMKKNVSNKDQKRNTTMKTASTGKVSPQPQVPDPAPGMIPGYREARAMFLYLLGNSYLNSGDRLRAMDICRSLQVLDESLGRLLFNKIVPS